jgi:transposase
MDHFAGLDVSVKETSVCIVDDTGRIVREVKVASEPDALLVVLTNPTYRFRRIGLEAGPLSQWLFSAVAEAGLPVICVETRHMRAALKAQINKTDRNDARGIAQMMRASARPLAAEAEDLRSIRALPSVTLTETPSGFPRPAFNPTDGRNGSQELRAHGSEIP